MFTITINSFTVTSPSPSQSPTHGMLVRVGDAVGVGVAVEEGAAVAVFVGVEVTVADGVSVGVAVLVADGELVGVIVGVSVGVAFGVSVGDAVGVGSSKTTISPYVPPAPGSAPPSRSPIAILFWGNGYSPGTALTAMLTRQL